MIKIGEWEIVVYGYYLEIRRQMLEEIMERVERHWTEVVNGIGGKESITVSLC